MSHDALPWRRTGGCDRWRGGHRRYDDLHPGRAQEASARRSLRVSRSPIMQHAGDML
jgi:hypothetical protein